MIINRFSPWLKLFEHSLLTNNHLRTIINMTGGKEMKYPRGHAKIIGIFG